MLCSIVGIVIININIYFVFSEETANEMQAQVEALNIELQKSQEKIASLENAIISMKSIRDSAVDEKNDLLDSIAKKDAEIEKCTANIVELTTKLNEAIQAKCNALDLNNDFESKENALKQREKRMEEEKCLLTSKITLLSEEVNRLKSELENVSLNKTEKFINMESHLADLSEKLSLANNTINKLSEENKMLNNQVETLTQRLLKQNELENEMAINYKKEFCAKEKIGDMYKSMYEEAVLKMNEMNERILELEKMLLEVGEKHCDLETKYKQAEKDKIELLNKENEQLLSLKNELELTKQLLNDANTQNLEMALSKLTPNAAIISNLVKSDMTFTQLYTQLVTMTDELTRQKEENKQLNTTVKNTVQELEKTVAALQQAEANNQEVLKKNNELIQQLDNLNLEGNKLKQTIADLSNEVKHVNQENTQLKKDLADLGRQLCYLLSKNYQHEDITDVDDNPKTALDSTSTVNSSTEVITKTLVTFSDIEELQSNNQKLLHKLRELTEAQEQWQHNQKLEDTASLQNKIKELENKITELTSSQDTQTKMVNALIRQRETYKKWYNDHINGKRQELSTPMETSNSDFVEVTETLQTNSNGGELENILRKTQQQLDELDKEYKTYKQEKLINEQMLYEQIENMRQDITNLTILSNKQSSRADYNAERIKFLEKCISTYKNQITFLEEKSKIYSNVNAQHESSIQQLRDDIIQSQQKLANAEVYIEKYKLESQLRRDAEIRLRNEKEILMRERQGQEILLKNLEMIKMSLERPQMENELRMECKLKELTQECALLKNKYKEEQDRFKQLEINFKRQTEISNLRIQEEKDAANIVRKEILTLRRDLANRNKSNEELAKKLKTALTPNDSDMCFDFINKNKELESKILEKENEIKSLQEHLNVANENLKEYCNKFDAAEKERNKLEVEYKDYKTKCEGKFREYEHKIQNLQEQCSELECELSTHSNGNTSHNSNIKTDFSIRNQLRETQEELAKCQEEIKKMCLEQSKLLEKAESAEEKYSQEILLHSADIQKLTELKDELCSVRNQLKDVTTLKDNIIKKIEFDKKTLEESEAMLRTENHKLLSRFEDLNNQNSILLDQIQALTEKIQISAQASDSLNESNNSFMNTSINEEDSVSSEKLFSIIKVLRKEKDIAFTKCDILEAESMRLKSQLMLTEKQLDDTKIALAHQKKTSELNTALANPQLDLKKKIESFDALNDSNRLLRSERDKLLGDVEKLTASIKTLENEIPSLREKISELTSKCDSLDTENVSLKADLTRWRNRVNALAERANKNSPDDWKRLQNERETLAKMLTAEKENVKKLSGELVTLKLENEENHTISHKHTSLIEDHKKLNESLQTLKEDMSRVVEESSKLKTELANALETIAGLTTDLSNKEATLNDLRNKEMQIKKIAKKYKCQYEELVKTVQSEKNKPQNVIDENEPNTNTPKTEELLLGLQNQLDVEKVNTEKLKTELELFKDKEEKAKQLLKMAKNEIVQLTETKKSLTIDLNESRNKIESMEQSNNEEKDVRLVAIKSQYEGRITRLEKEKEEAIFEKTKEIESLVQKINILQRQLVNQTGSKQQSSMEKSGSEPPTANIKPMAGKIDIVYC